MATKESLTLRKIRQVEPNSPGGRIVRRVLEEQFGYDFDPLIELIKLAQRTQSDAVAAKCYADACKYVYPQLKSIEVKSNVLHAVAMPDMELANRFRQYMIENLESKK